MHCHHGLTSTASTSATLFGTQQSTSQVRSSELLEMACVTDIFPHKPLDLSKRQIRLIRLEYGDHAPAIVCELQHFTFDSDQMPAYHALSYAWGGDDACREITINGTEIRIRTNLGAFLEQAQRSELREWIWIDQLCIAQQNTEERNHQVSIMSTIYGRAEHVIIWLGNPVSRHPTCLHGWLDDDEDEISTKFPQESSRCMLESVRAFVAVEYWQRLWIIQEIKLASQFSVWWGAYSFSPVRIKNLLARTRHDTIKNEDRSTWAKIRWLFGYLSPLEPLLNKEQGIRMFEIPTCVFTSKCKDPKDIVYGVQALLQDDSMVEVNYKGSVGVLRDEATIILISELWPAFEGNGAELRARLQIAGRIRLRLFGKSLGQVDSELVKDWTCTLARLLKSTAVLNVKTGAFLSSAPEERVLQLIDNLVVYLRSHADTARKSFQQHIRELLAQSSYLDPIRPAADRKRKREAEEVAKKTLECRRQRHKVERRMSSPKWDK